MEVDEDSAYDMDGGVLEADDADYDFGDQDANEHDTNLTMKRWYDMFLKCFT